jgi:16S rRNA G966 N2-methylase RsmD
LPFASAVATIASQAGDSLAGEIFFGPPRAMTNKLFYGDNLDVLRQQIKDESVDLVYLDPPFNSNANYNVLFKSPSGEK